ncbi:hypothetical protein [Candidatus Binatus sp.]|uniref:hypothetical protein n=1 Tax=Candidatus Binatus sp. TaxID=2811406 RepID=UPI003BAFF910
MWSRPLLIVRGLMVIVAGALASAACSSSSPAIVSAQKKVQGLLGVPNVTSFLDVRFGDSLYRVQNRFPNGSIETAPYGADTYRLNNIEVDGIRYSQVKYEFTTYSGMQLVMAWFTPDSSGKVLEKLVAAVGPPTEQNSAKGSAPADTQAIWQLPHGERVIYDGPKRFVAVVGPGGGPLKQDAAENETLDSP